MKTAQDIERSTSAPVRPNVGAATPMNVDLAGYWYEADLADARARSRAVLEALRLYRAAEMAMRRRTRESMAMGENELLVLRYLIRRGDTLVRPVELAAYLGVSTASMTALLDRLEKSGHITRVANPDDRRSIFVRATALTEDEVRETLGSMHDRMYAAVEGMSAAEAEAVIAFLDRMSAAVDAVAVDAP
ncbi:MarR family transcriptional regulator [Microbacterium sp. SSW1-59]|uniref:MarR family winged helix-turn-helix transcriptional regulator n=1 Tax=Microbacterium xanthum TaxID=3079794 RepID=UPI002AD442DE|nr:MarR family transcriptional regulator [Microbacterium sp. SSW1-59]MDZ8201338.1 MarR family transcriptional regulator [Microbacterium sp. SSW1-59]